MLALNTNTKLAEDKYNQIRQQLVRFFITKNLLNPEDCADKTIERISEKLQTKDGEILIEFNKKFKKLNRDKFEGVFFGVARLVALEVLREDSKTESKDFEKDFKPPFHDPLEELKIKEAELNSKERTKCKKECLDKLSIPNRKLIIEYYKIGMKAKSVEDQKRKREKLAKKQEITLINLRRKINYIKEKLNSCEKNCLKRYK